MPKTNMKSATSKKASNKKKVVEEEEIVVVEPEQPKTLKKEKPLKKEKTEKKDKTEKKEKTVKKDKKEKKEKKKKEKTEIVGEEEIEGDPKDRHFKLVSVNEEEVDKANSGRYTLPAKTKNGKPNRRGPKDLASKVFSQLCKKDGSVEELKFSIQETTRNRTRKVYTYFGKRVKLDKPQKYDVKYNDGTVRTITKEFRNELKAVRKDT